MTFTVTYRGTDGALREEAVDAAVRSECFAQMKARGIVPVSVREGASLGERASRPFRSRAKTSPRNARDARCPSGGGKPKSSIFNLKSSIILAAVVLAVVGGAWWWLAVREDVRPPEPKAVKVVKDIKVVKDVKGLKKVSAPVVTNTVPAAKPKLPERPANWKEMTKEERAAWNEEHPRPPQPANVTMESISSLRPKNPEKPIFNHHVQLELSHYAIPGRDMPPPDRITDKEALAAADVAVEYLDDDTAELRAKKEAVEGMLQEMKEYILNGGHANDYMNKLAERQMLEGEAVEATRRDVRMLMREGKMAEAKVALETYNEYLKAKGIPPIRIKGLK